MEHGLKASPWCGGSGAIREDVYETHSRGFTDSSLHKYQVEGSTTSRMVVCFSMLLLESIVDGIQTYLGVAHASRGIIARKIEKRNIPFEANISASLVASSMTNGRNNSRPLLEQTQQRDKERPVLLFSSDLFGGHGFESLPRYPLPTFALLRFQVSRLSIVIFPGRNHEHGDVMLAISRHYVVCGSQELASGSQAVALAKELESCFFEDLPCSTLLWGLLEL